MTDPVISLEALDAIEQRLEQSYGHLITVPALPIPDYSRQGVQTVFQSLVEARGQSDRAAEIHADAIRQRATARSIAERADKAYQDQRDRVVVQKAQSLGGLSWEERASFYRVELIAAEAATKKIRRQLTRIEALVEAIAILVRNLERTRYDLDAIIRVLQFAHSLGEIQ